MLSIAISQAALSDAAYRATANRKNDVCYVDRRVKMQYQPILSVSVMLLMTLPSKHLLPTKPTISVEEV